MSPKRVLLVEDSEFMIERVSDALQSEHDFAVTPASSVAEAKERTAEEGAFDCVVSNYDLPDGTGVDLVEWIREESPVAELPFVLLSGNSFDAIAPEAIDAGVSAFVSKTNDVSGTMDLFANRIRLAIRAAE